MKRIAALLFVLTLAACAGKPAPLPEPFVVFFKVDSAALTPEANEVVGRITTAAHDFAAARIGVEGNATGKTPHDQELAAHRAQAVAAALAAAGIEGSRIAIQAVRAPTGESGVAAHKVVVRFDRPAQ